MHGVLNAALAFVTLITLAAIPERADAQDPNQITVGIMSGGVTGTYARFAQHIMDNLDSGALRVVPMLGKGSQQNIKDLVRLNGVDVAIVQNDVLTEIRRTGEVEGVEHAIRYITKLYNEELHIVARSDVQALKSLSGQRVAIGRNGSGTQMTASILFDALGIDILPVYLGGRDAITSIQDGTIAAAVYVVGKPSSLIATLTAESGLKLMEISSAKTVDFPYFDTVLTSADYPALISEGTSVPTLAVGAVMAVFNWREGTRRYDLVSRFTTEFFEVLPVIQASELHPKWQDVDPAVQVPGWTRFKPAAEWVEANN